MGWIWFVFREESHIFFKITQKKIKKKERTKNIIYSLK